MAKRLVTAVCLIAALVGVNGELSGQQAGPGKGKARMRNLMDRMDRAARWWNKPEIDAALGLTAKQKAALDEMADEAKEKRRLAGADFAKAYAGLMTVLSSSEPGQPDIDLRRAELEEANASLARVSVDQLVTIRSILTDEQWTTLREVYPAAVQIGQMRMRGMGNAPSPGGGQ